MNAGEVFYFYIFGLKTQTLVEVMIFYLSNNKVLKWLKNAAEYFAKIVFLSLITKKPLYTRSFSNIYYFFKILLAMVPMVVP